VLRGSRVWVRSAEKRGFDERCGVIGALQLKAVALNLRVNGAVRLGTCVGKQRCFVSPSLGRKVA
jgi:hypothetical protein